MSLSAQLLHGLLVRGIDGQEVRCKPLPFKVAVQILDLWDQRFDPRIDELAAMEPKTPEVVAELARRTYTARHAQAEIQKLFMATYPDLDGVIGLGDVERLLLDFFVAPTGASVVRNGVNASTGMPVGAGTSPPGESPPSP